MSESVNQQGLNRSDRLREQIAAAIRSDELVRVSVATSLRMADAVLRALNMPSFDNGKVTNRDDQ